MRSLLSVALCFLACACSTSSLAGKLPWHKDLSGYPAALLESTLVRDGDCLYAQAGDSRYLAIWPGGYSLVGGKLMRSCTQVATVGDIVKLGGGAYENDQYTFLRTLMLDDAPEACRDEDYWLVSDVSR